MKPTENPKEVYQDADPVELPENAFRELAEDEGYRPIMHPARDYPEVTPYSVGMGLLLAVIFSAAAAYLGLKVGQVFEAAIPIAIIAVGLSGALKKRIPWARTSSSKVSEHVRESSLQEPYSPCPHSTFFRPSIRKSPSTSCRYFSARS